MLTRPDPLSEMRFDVARVMVSHEHNLLLCTGQDATPQSIHGDKVEAHNSRSSFAGLYGVALVLYHSGMCLC